MIFLFFRIFPEEGILLGSAVLVGVCAGLGTITFRWLKE
jgi:hypothetical protein